MTEPTNSDNDDPIKVLGIDSERPDELEDLMAELDAIPDEEPENPAPAKTGVDNSAKEKLAEAWSMDKNADDPNKPYFDRVVDLAWHHSTDTRITENAREWLLSNSAKQMCNDEIIAPKNLGQLVQIVATQIAAYRTGVMTHGYRLTPQFWEKNDDRSPDESGKLRKNLDAYLDALCVMFGRVNQSQPFKKFTTKDGNRELISRGSPDHNAICDFVTDSYTARERVNQLALKPWEELQSRTLLSRPAKGIRKQVAKNYSKVLGHVSTVLADLEEEGTPARKRSAKEITDHWAALMLGSWKDAIAVEFDRQRLGLIYDQSDGGKRQRKAHRARVARSRKLLAATPFGA